MRCNMLRRNRRRLVDRLDLLIRPGDLHAPSSTGFPRHDKIWRIIRVHLALEFGCPVLYQVILQQFEGKSLIQVCFRVFRHCRSSSNRSGFLPGLGRTACWAWSANSALFLVERFAAAAATARCLSSPPLQLLIVVLTKVSRNAVPFLGLKHTTHLCSARLQAAPQFDCRGSAHDRRNLPIGRKLAGSRCVPSGVRVNMLLGSRPTSSANMPNTKQLTKCATARGSWSRSCNDCVSTAKVAVTRSVSAGWLLFRRRSTCPADRGSGKPHHRDSQRPARCHRRHGIAPGALLRDIGRVLTQPPEALRIAGCRAEERRGDRPPAFAGLR